MLAKRREAQLEELRCIQRERARAQASGGAAAGARTRPARVPQTTQRSQPRPQPLPQAQLIPSQRADRNRGQRPQPQRQQVRPQAVRHRSSGQRPNSQEMFAAMERQRLQDTGESTTHRIVGAYVPASSAAAAKHLPPSTGNPLRDAFLMQELLGPPLSMREVWHAPGLDSLVIHLPGNRPDDKVHRVKSLSGVCCMAARSFSVLAPFSPLPVQPGGIPVCRRRPYS